MSVIPFFNVDDSYKFVIITTMMIVNIIIDEHVMVTLNKLLQVHFTE